MAPLREQSVDIGRRNGQRLIRGRAEPDGQRGVRKRRFAVFYFHLDWSIVQGVLVLAGTATIFALALSYGLATDQVRGLTFASLVFAIVALTLVDRLRLASILTAVTRSNHALALVLPMIGVLLAATLL
jgi:hypothetical protein